MEKGWIAFSVTSLEPGGNSEPNGYTLKLQNFQENLKKRCCPIEKGRIEFSKISGIRGKF